MSSLRLSASLPKEKLENMSIVKYCLPQGVPIIVNKARKPNKNQAKPLAKSPRMDQNILPIKRNMIDAYCNYWLNCWTNNISKTESGTILN
ncbi:MAG: hypothetical protein ACI9NY_001873 [Kiritimatiellia bacterium]|jgi:hypothetical protein